MSTQSDEWRETQLGSLELVRGGEVRGYVMNGGFWRTAGSEMGSEKDVETAKIALRACCDVADIQGASVSS